LLRLRGEEPSNAHNSGLVHALDRAAAQLSRHVTLYVQDGRNRMRAVTEREIESCAFVRGATVLITARGVALRGLWVRGEDVKGLLVRRRTGALDEGAPAAELDERSLAA
jgi:hypothetical protein